jgi:nicotinamide phosphoribosyltransferase
MNPLLYTDYYKTEHQRMYPDGTTLIYSNMTPRKSRMEGVDAVVVFEIQHFIKEYLIEKFNVHFFNRPKAEVLAEYERHVHVNTGHIAALHDLGYLPIEIKALPEGTLCPIRVPLLTIKNTHPDFFWLTNYIETLMSCMLWQGITSATIAYEYRKILNKFALETTGTTDFVQWQGHDFSMRGMSSVESAILSGMGHLLSFTGTDTIPAIYQLEASYGATGLIGASVPATEHSVMCMGTKDDEIGTFRTLLGKYPTGILSIVSDTWDLWKVCTEHLPVLKDEILARDGRLVIRPDSGDPVDIICGTSIVFTKELTRENIVALANGKARHRFFHKDGVYYEVYQPESDYDPQRWEWKVIEPTAEHKGVIELLWETFGGETNDYGYKVLDTHIGAIYGDSITLDRAKRICERLKTKGFASTNIVLGIGSYTYNYNTRDTFGFAVKATYGEVTEYVSKSDHEAGNSGLQSVGREIFKDPITDDGTKKSAKGLLRVLTRQRIGDKSPNGTLILQDQCTWEQEAESELQTVFKDGKLYNETTLDEIRQRLNEQHLVHQ